MFASRTRRGTALTVVAVITTITLLPPTAQAAASIQQKRAAKAVAVAEAQLGDPYRYGATGPDAFDCSGLVQHAWRKAGVELPRVTGGQYRALHVKVSWSDVKPGDLMFFGGFGHVAMYVGGGRIIHAPRTGERVRFERLNQKWLRSTFSGAARPGA
ncbi:C40 family peptidase [Nonomuraea sp. NPDC046802]|uniref:C40 family peptidase n=1 Tax=Nonomuraea sp. NPDC046802 TaxID=3154919 RepID=UPI0033D7DFB9